MVESIKFISLFSIHSSSVLIVCILYLRVILVFAESDSNPANNTNEFEITNSTFLSVMEHLGKFGWVEPSDWTAFSPRNNETINEGKVPFSLSDIQTNESQGNTTTHGKGSKASKMTDDQFVNALRRFQEAYTLEVTGSLNEATLLVMTQLRCGVPDQTEISNSTVTFVDNSTDVDEVVPLEQYGDSVDFPSGAALSNVSSEHTMESTTAHSLRKRSLTNEVTIASHGLNIQRSHFSPVRIAESRFDGNSTEEATEEVLEETLPEQSRVESMKEVLEALRKETLHGKDRKQIKKKNVFSLTNSSLMSRLLSVIENNQIQNRREKRSAIYKRNGWGLVYAKKTISWRLVQEWSSTLNPLLSNSEVWFTVKLAFRMWSEVIPRNFVEDNYSPVNEVDVLIGFGTGSHNRCLVKFEDASFLQVYAHAWPLPKAEIHFNDNQLFIPISLLALNAGSYPFGISPSHRPISLLKVAIHEIGHVLGLPHNSNRYSIMNPVYKPHPGPDLIELSIPDRKSMKELYGACDLSFDAVFDWVRQSRSPSGRGRWKYNTHFFRKTWFWLYENRVQRPRYGHPKLTAQHWRGIMQHPVDPHYKIDGAVHIRSWRSYLGPTFFFKGDIYMEYDSMRDQTKRFDRHGRPYPRRIEDDFQGIPYPINTVYYNFKEELIYFFKANKVYRYNWTEGELLDSAQISKAFPGWGGASPLSSNIDAAYYSYAYQATYFFKGEYYWKLADRRDREKNEGIHIPYLAVGPRRRISSKWRYLCDVGDSELIMNLPSSSD